MDDPTEYTVCKGESREELAEKVMDGLRNGWVCHGDLVVATIGTTHRPLFFQAMVR